MIKVDNEWKHTEEEIEKMKCYWTLKKREIRKQRNLGKDNPNYNKRFSYNTKKQMSLSHIELFSKYPQMKGWMRELRLKQSFLHQNTKPELKAQSLLKELGMEFFTHQYIEGMDKRYRCDIFIPSLKVIIEIDGDYWHGNPMLFEIFNNRQKWQIERDKNNTLKLESVGFKVLRIWENEINTMSLENFKTKLQEVTI